MGVFRGSRYEDVRFTGILGEDGKVRRFLHAREPLSLQTVRAPIRAHALEQGEQLDDLASRVANQARLWWVIADVSGVFFALDIEPGTQVSIPTTELRERGRAF